MEQSVEFIDLKNHSNYEILSVYPHTLRRKDNHYEIKPTLDKNGYYIVMLQDDDGRHKYSLHRLIAQQFVDNPNNLPEVDHVNRNRTDNHIENLRFVSKVDNCRNKASYSGVVHEYVDEIDEDAISVVNYGNHEFEDYYFHDDKFYFFNGIQYRILPIKESIDGYKFVNVIDTNHKKIKIFYTKFKRENC